MRRDTSTPPILAKSAPHKPLYVTLCDGKRIGIRTYRLGWEQVRKDVSAGKGNLEYKRGLSTWWPTTAADILGQYQDGLHDRINTRGGVQHGKGSRALRRIRKRVGEAA